MESIDLCVPIYLNQQIVFDLLAVLEDGFSRLSTIKTSTAETESQKSTIGGAVGLSNIFALLGVSFKGERDKEKGTQEQAEVSQEKIHTPTSLFAKLRLILNNKELLQILKTEEEIQKLMGGQFVEFRALLKKNPLVDAIEGSKQLMQMAALFVDKGDRSSKGGKSRKGGHPRDSKKLITQQLDAMLTALTQSNSLELIAEMLDIPGVKAVLSTKINYFSDQNASEIIDGEFHVLGKITRVVPPDCKDSINLLRKTSFGLVKRNIFDQLKNAFAGAEEHGLNFPELITEIQGPALQIIPIAIFT